jgi:uncharacterized protein
MPSDLPVILAGAFVAAFAVGAVGFGDALIAAAIWLFVIEPAVAVPLMVMCGVLLYAVTLVRMRRRLDFSAAMPFVIGGILGVPIGAWLLAMADPTLFRLGVGSFLVVYAAVFLTVRAMPRVTAGGRSADGAVGVVGGVLVGLAGFGAVAPAIWSGLRGWTMDRQRGAFQTFGLAIDAVAFAWYLSNGMITPAVGVYFLWSVPATLIGAGLGMWFYGRLDERLFRRMVLGLLMLSGVLMLSAAAGGFR